MLGKLLKYELKAMGRIMIPLYGVILMVSVLLAFSMRLSMTAGMRTLIEKLAIVSSVLLVVAVAASIVTMLILTLQRFYRNLLGTEGYLMFTLPVSTADNILSKLISSMIWIILGILTGVAAGFLMVMITSSLPELMREFENLWKMIVSDQNSALVMKNIILFAVMLLVGIMASLCKVYASIAIGHQWGEHRLLGAVLAYIGIGILELLLSQIPGVGQFIQNRVIEDASSIKVFTVAIIVSLLQTLVYGSVAWILLDRRLNLE